MDLNSTFVITSEWKAWKTCRYIYVHTCSHSGKSIHCYFSEFSSILVSPYLCGVAIKTHGFIFSQLCKKIEFQFPFYSLIRAYSIPGSAYKNVKNIYILL